MNGLVQCSWKLFWIVWVAAFCMSAQGQSTPTEITTQPSTFYVKTFQIQGNTLISGGKLLALLAHLIGTELTLNDLHEVTSVVQQAYRKAGYGGVIAFVPEQTLENGEVVINVVEGRLANVSISDNKRYDETNILASLPGLRKGTTPIIRDIDRNIQMANENPAKDMRVALVAGARPGEIDADIKVNEERPLRLLLGVDSAGTPTTGNFRTNAGIQHANLWNRDHIGTFQFQTSPTDPGRVQIYSVGYRVPFYNYFAAIDAFYAHSSVDSVSSPLQGVGPLGFTGKGDVAGFRAYRFLPRLGDYDQRLTFGWDWRRFNNQCSFGEFGSAGCGAASADVAITPLSLGYTGQTEGPGISWGFSSSVSGNVGGSSNSEFDAVRLGADKHYFIWRFFTFGNLALPAGFGLAARVSAQYSPHALVPGEQFGIGGGGSAMGGIISVRGYREREVVGDYGTSFNLEGLGPDFAKWVNSESVSIRPLIFFDFGWAGNNLHTPCNADGSSCTLAGVGGGFRFSIGKRLYGRLDLGHALIDGNQKEAGTTRGHLAINFSY